MDLSNVTDIPNVTYHLADGKISSNNNFNAVIFIICVCFHILLWILGLKYNVPAQTKHEALELGKVNISDISTV